MSPRPKNMQGERKETVVVGLKPAIKRLLQVAAKDQCRSGAGQVEKYVIDGLLRDGYIRPTVTATIQEKTGVL